MPSDQLEGTIEALSAPAWRVLIIAVVALVLLRLGRGFLDRLVARRLQRDEDATADEQLAHEDRERRVATVTALVEWVLRLLILVTAALLLLTALDLTPVILVIALVVAAVAFAGHDLIRDYIAGVMIVLENQFGIGDYVSVAGHDGDVESFSLRRTLLRNDDGDLVSIPNGEIRIARNQTRTWARINLEVGIAAGARLPDAIGVVEATGRDMSADPSFKGALLEVPAVLGVSGFDDTGVRLLIRGRIRASDRLRTTLEYRRRLLASLLEAGLEPSMARRVALVPDASSDTDGERLRGMTS